MNEYAADTALRISAGVEGDRLRLQVRARTDEDGRATGASGQKQALAEVAVSAVELRRELQSVQACSAAQAVINDIFRLERIRSRPRFGPRLTPIQHMR